ncbi:MAG: FAD-dependent monooxygenase [Caulobacteraceae bacterium]|nr:FAD-dependent monooxygenase [Caulobacter sp.]
MAEASNLYDVVIAGAGPVGLFLACDLRRAGLSVLVLEQAATPETPLKRLPFGVRGLSTPSIEALHRRGLLAELAEGADPGAGAHWKAAARTPGGHFAGIQFFADRIDASQWRWRLQSPLPPALPVALERLEAVLAAHAEAAGVDIRRGLAVEGLDPTEDEVAVRTGGDTLRARWLVGCDGGRSTVRKLAGFGFAGTEPEFTGYMVEVEMDAPTALPLGRHYTATGVFTHGPPGVIAMVDFDGGASHRAQPITPEHVQAVLRHVSGVDVTLTGLKLASTWTDRAFQATAYRRGRVLLAGDAAHVHSPLGGQGLNLGLGDAANLAWKLAATLRGDAPAGLLDTYDAERRPVGASVLDWSRAQVALMRPTPSTRALEAIMRDLIGTRDGATYFAERVWGVSLRYDLGDAHPLVGRSLPDFALADGRRAGDLLADGRGLLLDFDGRGPLRALADCWAGRLAFVACDAHERLGLSAVLARPDGIVAWVSEGAPDEKSAAEAAARWLGAPLPSTSGT